jgi:hypothetical protein
MLAKPHRRVVQTPLTQNLEPPPWKATAEELLVLSKKEKGVSEHDHVFSLILIATHNPREA